MSRRLTVLEYTESTTIQTMHAVMYGVFPKLEDMEYTTVYTFASTNVCELTQACPNNESQTQALHT